MNNPKHTPGPWYTCFNARSDMREYVRADDRELAICKLIGDEISEPIGTMEANARLIAAAPELLDALESLLLEIEAHDIHAPARIAFAKRAIAKATGGAE